MRCATVKELKLSGTNLVRPCMSSKAPMSDHWGGPGGRCVPRTSVRMILFEERPPALVVEAEEYPRAHQEPVYKAGRRWCRVGGPDWMVKQMRSPCPVTRSSVSMVATRKLVVIGERLALAECENTAAGRSK